MKNRYRAVIWDLDGTLIDSAPDICRSLNAVLNDFGHDALTEARVRPMIGDGVAKLLERGFEAVDVAVDRCLAEEATQRFMVHYAESPAGLTRLYPGAQSSLEGIAGLGIKQGICTNKPEAVSRAVLHDLGIDHHFRAIVGGDTARKKKPDPEPLERCLALMEASADSSLMIGDSEVDIATARTLGIPIGLVTFGYARSAVSTLDTDFLIEDLAELPSMLGRRQ